MKRANAFIGSPIERIEDLRFLRGRGKFVDDLNFRATVSKGPPAGNGTTKVIGRLGKSVAANAPPGRQPIRS